MKYLIAFLLAGLLSVRGVTQTAFNTDGSPPNSKAEVDISSTTMGLLIPRLTTAQRNTLETTLTAGEKGLWVYDTDLNKFFFFNGSSFEQVANGVLTFLRDTDGDTYLKAEAHTDEDKIRFAGSGTEYFVMDAGRLHFTNTGKSVFMGYQAGANDDLSDNRNLFIGYRAGRYTTSGEQNNALGREALSDNTTGSMNTAAGYSIMKRNTTGSNNTALGNIALYQNNSGDFNTAAGSHSLYTNSEGYRNSAFGRNASYWNTAGNKNSALGSSALYSVKNDSLNTAAGYQTSGSSEATGNTALGKYVLYSNDDGEYNTALGNDALGHIYGNDNTAIGVWSGYNIQEGYSNTAVGFKAFYGSYSGAGRNNIVAVGDSALYKNATSSGSGEGINNTATGYKSLYANTKGSYNTAFGALTLNNNTEGNNNTAFGDSALFNNLTGNYNIAAGKNALFSNEDSNMNIAIGNDALYNQLSGNRLIAVGNGALYTVSNKRDNTAIGYHAGYKLGENASGTDEAVENTVIGSKTATGHRVVGPCAASSPSGPLRPQTSNRAGGGGLGRGAEFVGGFGPVSIETCRAIRDGPGPACPTCLASGRTGTLWPWPCRRSSVSWGRRAAARRRCWSG